MRETLVKEYTNPEGERIIIKEMTDYHLRNAFNYFIRRHVEVEHALQAAQGQYKALAGECEEYICMPTRNAAAELMRAKARLESLDSIIRALGTEAMRRGTKQQCGNCRGTGKINDRNPCLVCNGTGWQMGGVVMRET